MFWRLEGVPQHFRITEARQASNDGSDAMGWELELLLPLSPCSKRKAVERGQSGLPQLGLRTVNNVFR